MVAPTNILQNVITYNEAQLGYLLNENAFIHTANKAYSNFQQANPANLGDVISFDKPMRVTSTNSLVAQFQGIQQRVQQLTVDKPISVSLEITSQELIFNLEDYMSRIGIAAVNEMGAKIEADVAKVCVQNTYRFYGDGYTPVNSSGQLAQALAFFKNYGSSSDNVKGYLPDLIVPGIINTNLNQFVPGRNDSEANSWELGPFMGCEWYQSNLLPVHSAGTEGNSGVNHQLTVVSTTVDSAGAVTAITFSGCTSASDANSVKQYDKFQFVDGVSGKPNLRFRTWQGHEISGCPVQFQAVADAASTAGSQVTVTVNPPLQATQGRNQNISQTIVAGMKVKVLPDHRAGMIQSGNQFYLAMPRLPDYDPYKTGVAQDSESGASCRMYTGGVFGQNLYGTVYDCIYGYTLVDDNAMSIITPV